jgi:MSHA pilin protein MshA
MKKQRGFTLLELVVVLVVLGILVVTALPKLVDLTGDAGYTATSRVAGAIASATAANYAAKAVGKPGTLSITALHVCSPDGLSGTVAGIDFSLGTTANTSSTTTYGIGGMGVSCSGVPGGTAVFCNLRGSKGAAQSATVICSG